MFGLQQALNKCWLSEKLRISSQMSNKATFITRMLEPCNFPLQQRMYYADIVGLQKTQKHGTRILLFFRGVDCTTFKEKSVTASEARVIFRKLRTA